MAAVRQERQEELGELVGPHDGWGQKLGEGLWDRATADVCEYPGSTESLLEVPCSYDLNVAATKYFDGLEGGEVPLLFLFSGTIFYEDDEGRLQIQQVSWNCESAFRMPIATWQAMMDEHYPNSAWLALDRGLFDKLYAFRRREGLSDWDQTITRLLAGVETGALAKTE